jgi:purine-cytosine permease-like protein
MRQDAWEVELKGIAWVPDAERRGVPRDLGWPWAAANLSVLPVAYGVFVVGLGLNWWQAAIAVIIGCGVSYPLVGLVALAGMRGGAPTMTLSRAAFGHHGNVLPTALSYVSLVGWETVSVTLGVLATRTVLGRIGHGMNTVALLAVSFVVIAAATIVLAVYGYNMIMRVQRWITLAVTVMTVIYLIILLPSLHFAATAHGGNVGTLIGGITLTATATGLAWTNCGADYSRYLPRGSAVSAVVGWTSLGGALPPFVLMLFGILLTTGDPGLASAAANDPVAALAGTLPDWFLFPFLLTVILSVIAAAVVDLYSSGLNLLALGLRVSRPFAVAIDGTLMILGSAYIVFVSPSFFTPFQAFLSVLGVAMASWTAVFLVDLFVHRRSGYLADELYAPRGAYGRFNTAGVLSFVVAVIVGLGLITSTDPALGRVLGYLLTPAAKAGSIGASNLGVVVAFVVAGACYALLSITVFRPHTTVHTGAQVQAQ